MMNQRERIKELWNSFSDSSCPYIELGLDLYIMAKHKSHIEWGHRNIRDYLQNELHMPPITYNRYTSVAKQLMRLQISPSELHSIESRYKVIRVMEVSKASRTKDELFQRLSGDLKEVSRKKYFVGPFNLSRKEIRRVWAANRIAGVSSQEFKKKDLLNIVDFIIMEYKKSKPRNAQNN